MVEEKNVYKTCSETYSKITNLLSRISGNPYGYAFFSTKRLISLLKKENPDIVHLQCTNGYFVNVYKLLRYLGQNRIKTVLTLHAEFMYTGGCGHAFDCEKFKTECGHCSFFRKDMGSLFFENSKKCFNKMKKAFSYFEDDNLSIVAVSPWLKGRAEESAILKGKDVKVVFNGVDDGVFRYRKDIDKKYLELTNGYDKKVLFVTPYFSLKDGDIKGGEHVVALAKLCSDIVFLVAGGYEENLNLPKNVILLGRINDKDKLSSLYSFADATILASKRETFSMVVAESLCCGTQVVGFKAGAPEQIAVLKYSAFVDYGDIEALKTALYKKLEDTSDKESISKEAIKVYGKDEMVKNYIKVYKEILKNG